MCGISLIYDPSSSADTPAQTLRMHATIRHRGPDEERFLRIDRDGPVFNADPREFAEGGSARVTVAFRRLRIIDLSERASQPMASGDGSLWIVFNGEIYNFASLRQQLRDQYAFRSDSDTEVILAAYQRWGNDCWRQLSGMWAVVIVDLRSNRLVASRDRFGIKPLFWSRQGAKLLLSSEARQIVAALEKKPAANRELVRRFLEGIRFPLLHESFFEGIDPFPPGHFLEVSLQDELPQTFPFRPYYELPSAREANTDQYENAVDRMEAVLRDVIRSHAVADVPVGSLLSGGLDSSLLAVMLAQRQREQQRDAPTYSFGFDDAPPEYRELTRAASVAEMHHLPNCQISFDATWVEQHAADVVRTLEEPPMGMSALAQYRVFQLCRDDGTTVVLDGQASDELFGGYPYHLRLYLVDCLKKHQWNEFFSAVRSMSRREMLNPISVLIRELGPGVARKMGIRWSGTASTDWIAPDYGRGRDSSLAERAFYDRGRDPSLVQQRVYWDVKWGNVRLILDYADRSSMAASIESRVPYLDDQIVELALSFPDRFRVGAGERKRILRDIGRRFLPLAATEERRRIGFYTPQADMLRGPLRPVVEEALEDRMLRSSGIIDGRRVKAMKNRFEQGDDSAGEAVWRLWMLVLWSREFRAALA
jgi:asparagine synthase (glutamine-hydrolysing)